MHPAVVRCTGADFVRDAGQCCTDSSWELRERRDAFGASVQWLEATYPLPPAPDKAAASGAPLLVTVCVLYNASFAVPQLGFHTATVTGLDELQASLPRLTFLNATSAADSCGKAETSRRPLVSFTWSEELGQHMWLVHPCDTERVLRCRRYDEDRGDVLGVFLRAMAGYFPLAPPLLPSSGGPFDPYKILGVKPDASKSDIKKAYHRLALRFHPDSGAEGNAARFAAVNEAYEAVKDGTWKPTARDQAKAAEHGGGGWDPKMRMYVYEQPGSTMEGYVTGDTEKYLRMFMIGCFVFIALRLSLFFLMPARKRNAAAQGGGEAPGGADGAASTTAFGLPATPPGQPAAPFTAGGHGSGSVHADDEVEYKWGDAASASAPMKDPLSHR